MSEFEAMNKRVTWQVPRRVSYNTILLRNLTLIDAFILYFFSILPPKEEK